MTTDDKTTDQTEDQGPDTPETAGQDPDNVTVTEQSEDTDTPAADENGTEEPAEDADTFPRAYVEDLRKESAGYRTQVRELQERLHRMSVEQTGSLADPADLPFDPAHLDSPEALQAAIAELLAAKPHLKARKFVGDVGQGSRGSANAGVDLLGILRSRA